MVSSHCAGGHVKNLVVLPVRIKGAARARARARVRVTLIALAVHAGEVVVIVFVHAVLDAVLMGLVDCARSVRYVHPERRLHVRGVVRSRVGGGRCKSVCWISVPNSGQSVVAGILKDHRAMGARVAATCVLISPLKT